MGSSWAQGIRRKPLKVSEFDKFVKTGQVFSKACRRLKRWDQKRRFQVTKKTRASLTNALIKYWSHRQTLFRQIDSGNFYLTPILWFSVTPEDIATFIARFARCCLPEATTVVNLFCGAGGLMSQMAREFPHVLGVDNNLEHLFCTIKNCSAYGVGDKAWVQQLSWGRKRSLEKLRARSGLYRADCVVLSPPWGGVEYLRAKQYDLETSLEPLGITDLLRSIRTFSDHIMMFLPRNSNLGQLSMATQVVFGTGVACKVLYMKQNGYSKGLLALWGPSFTMKHKTEVDYNELA